MLKHTEKKDGYYITFKGIKWSKHEDSSVVDIDEDENQIKTEKLELPKGLDAVIYENEINFQNYGNSIDYYVKVEECERKFVQLKKQ